MKVSANISTKLRQNSEFHALCGWASQAVACGSVEDFSSTSQLLLYTSTSATSYCLQPCLSSPSPLLTWIYAKIKTTNACRLLLPLFSVSGGVFSSFMEASYISMWSTAVQHYQVFPLPLYFGLGQVVVLNIADNNTKSLQSPEICSNQKKQTLQYHCNFTTSL